ncbi:MAG: hypothetical protein RIS19_951 [Actinomycetota bacterium]
MRLSLRSRVSLNSTLAILLAFTFPLSGALASYATQTPAQQVSQLQADLATYTQHYSNYVGHYQQYAPNNISELNQFASSLTTFSSAVATAQSALTASNTANQDLATAQANVDAVPGLISTSQQALATAQTNYDAASTSLAAIQPSYSAALQDRNDAWSAYQATVVNSTVTEEFNGATISTGIQVLVGGTTPITTTGNPYLANGMIFINANGPGLLFVPAANTTPTGVAFQTYARNGDQQVTANFTDGTSENFTNPNGVPTCPNYTCDVSYTAPSGKTIQSLWIPGDFDILYINSITFSNSSYDATAYQNYQDKQAALDAVAPTYNAANSAFTQASQTLASAQAAYNTYSAPSYLTRHQELRSSVCLSHTRYSN